MRTTVTILLAAAMTLVACDDEKPAKTDEPAPQPKPAEPVEPGETGGGAGGDYAEFTDDQWCVAAHEETVKLVEGIKTSMKENGQENEYEVAPREEYVALCRELPLEMQKCVVIGYAQRHEKECRAREEALEGEDRKNYQQLMGK
jgi:hypothetical protein